MSDHKYTIAGRFRKGRIGRHRTRSRSDSEKKFHEMLLYIAKQSESDRDFGAVKLNKILFFADLAAYAATGETISGQRYVRLDLGPAPKALLPVRQRLVDNGEAAIQNRGRFGPFDTPQQRLVALREPKLGCFSGADIDIINQTIQDLRGQTGRDVSDQSHDFIGWQITENNEEIPFETWFIDPRDLTPQERRHAASLVPYGQPTA